MSPSRYERAMKELSAWTRPSELGVLRCKERIEQDLPVTAPSARTWQEPTPRALRRVRWRIRNPQPSPSYRPLIHAGLALSLVLVLWVAFSPSLFSPVTPSTPTVLSLASSGPAALSPSPHLDLHYSGKGRLQSEDRRWALMWEQGSVTVQLDPQANATLEVQTEDALVEVIGTVFDVRRDTLGTSVSVERGLVRVTCRQSQETLTLGADHTHTCWPATPSGLLARAIHLSDHQAPDDIQLETLDAGLAISPSDDPVYGEMITRQITTFLRTDRKREALEAAHRYLDLPERPREAEILDMAVQLSSLLGDCEDARNLATEMRAPLPPSSERVLENCR